MRRALLSADLLHRDHGGAGRKGRCGDAARQDGSTLARRGDRVSPADPRRRHRPRGGRGAGRHALLRSRRCRSNWVKHDFGVPIWFWRSVGATHNTFVTETFIDEMARAAGARIPTSSAASCWTSSRVTSRCWIWLPRRPVGASRCPRAWGAGSRGGSFGGWTARGGRGSIEDGRPRVHRVVCAVDCGTVVNPEQVEAQMESAIIYCVDGRALRPDHVQGRQGRAGQLRRLPGAAHDRSAEDRGPHRRRAGEPGGVGEPGTPPPPGTGQCVVPGDRQAHPHAAAQPAHSVSAK